MTAGQPGDQLMLSAHSRVIVGKMNHASVLPSSFPGAAGPVAWERQQGEGHSPRGAGPGARGTHIHQLPLLAEELGTWLCNRGVRRGWWLGNL